jgi:Nucleotide modification associated domain 2
MDVFSYVIEHDLGFAPNPFHGVCTLACCKPEIRKKAQIGDLILGMGAVRPRLSGHLCYWMWVDEILTFDEYWADPRFRRKRPVVSATTYLRYGDNIYHHEPDDPQFRQEDSFHSLPDGALSIGNRKRDTGKTDRVLIGRRFTYLGRSGIPVPESLKCFRIRSPGHKRKFTDVQKAALLSWLEPLSLVCTGYRDQPAHWQFLNKKRSKPLQRPSGAARSASA